MTTLRRLLLYLERVQWQEVAGGGGVWEVAVRSGREYRLWCRVIT